MGGDGTSAVKKTNFSNFCQNFNRFAASDRQLGPWAPLDGRAPPPPSPWIGLQGGSSWCRPLCAPGIPSPGQGERGGGQPLPRDVTVLPQASPALLLQHPSTPSSSSSLPPSRARTGPRPEPGLGVSGPRAPPHLNLLQEVGGEQPHLAAGVDLDIAASFVSFLHDDLGSERMGEQELNSRPAGAGKPGEARPGLGAAGSGTRATWSFFRVICPISRLPTKDLVTRCTRSPARTRMMKFGGKNPTFSPIFP